MMICAMLTLHYDSVIKYDILFLKSFKFVRSTIKTEWPKDGSKICLIGSPSWIWEF